MMKQVRNCPNRLTAAILSVICGTATVPVALAEALATEADAIVAVEVAFVPYGDMVLIEQVLHGEMIELSSTSELLSACLPNKARVRELAEQAGNTPQAQVYRQSIESAGYKAVVFLKHDGAQSRVLCDENAVSTVNWESDPRYPEWRARLQDEIESRNE